jgi:hypothetical protein
MLDALRLEGDPLADGVIAALEATDDLAAINRVLAHLTTNDQAIPTGLPPALEHYLIATDQPPAWTDYDRIARARSFFYNHGMHISLVLSTAAMVQCYAAQRAVQVLALTQELEYPQHRVAETAQFCLHMMGERGFQAGGQFIPATQKVRLIHGAVRYLITHSARWDPATMDTPICQEDLLGALLVFTTEVLKGLERLGIAYTPQEAEDYYYVWRVTGAMLGIRPEIMPETLAEATDLNALLRARHFGPSPEGAKLTRCLLEMYDRVMPGEIFDGVIPAVIRQAAGDEIADWMEVPHSNWGWVVKHSAFINTVLEELQDRNNTFNQVFDKACWAVIQGEFHTLSNGEPAVYDIPIDLRAAWGLEPPPESAG